MFHRGSKDGPFARFARFATQWTGTTTAFGIALATVFVWIITGPFFHYSDTWQLVINTGTTIVTFLMVFLIQRAQNNDSHAIHLKLNEIVASIDGASNRLINAENLSEDELKLLQSYYRRLVVLSGRDDTFTQSHSVEEAELRHRRKHNAAQSQTESDEMLADKAANEEK